MLKLIIADDERAIRESISRLIDWESLGLLLVGQCKNGLEALDMVLDESPDIVLTDIKMPGLSGVELVERISQTGMNTQFILLSGYADFAYAQQAMRFGVRHYLLKPCSEQQLVETLTQVIAECRQNRIQQAPSLQQDDSLYTMQRGILMNIIAEATADLSSDYSAMYTPHQRYMDFTYTDYVMGFVYDIERAALPTCYKRILEYHQKYAPGIPLHGIYVKNCLMIFCVGYPLADESTRELMAQLRHTFPSISWETRHFPNLAELLDEILLYTQHYGTIFYVEPGKLIPVSNFKNVFAKTKECCRTMLALLDEKPADLPDLLQLQLSQLSAILSRIDNLDYMKLLVSAITFEMANRELFGSVTEVTQFNQTLHSMESANDIREKAIAFLSEALQTTITTTTQGQLVQQIKDYVNANLANPNLTLKLIAETHLYMNVDYVSKRFLKEAGCRFSAYLSDVRVQKAIQLLTSGEDSRIQTVAEQVGCGNNPQYFSQVFKKSTGMTPSAYLRQVRGG